MCERIQDLKISVKEKFNDNKEFISVFAMSYGVVFVVTMCIIGLTEDANWLRFLLDGFVPTTIAFCGTVIIQEYTNSRIHISAIIFVLVLVISLTYLMYIFSGIKSTFSGGEAVYNVLYGYISIGAMLFGIGLTKLYYPAKTNESPENRKNDGDIGG